MSKKAKKLIALVCCVIALAVVFIIGFRFFPGGESSAEEPTGENTVQETPRGLIINEVVSSSRYSYLTEDGQAADWIELYNGSDSSMSLAGMTLSDDEKDPLKCELPAVTVPAHGYLLVLCDGKTDAEDGFVHVGFRMSSKGDFVGLYSGTTEIHSLEIPALGKDISYGRDVDGRYRYLGVTTPGLENSAVSAESADLSELADKLSSAELVINEYQIGNITTLMDEDGEHGEWLEIRNVSSEVIALGEYALSDNSQNMGKWSFPERTLDPGACCIVFLSGKDRTEAELHTGFALGADDTYLLLSRKGTGLVDMITIDHNIAENCSAGRTKDGGWAYFPSPTPGTDNLTKSFERLDISEEKYLP